MIKELSCNKCNNKSFLIHWKYKAASELQRLTLGHDGFGLQLEDAEFICSKCNAINSQGIEDSQVKSGNAMSDMIEHLNKNNSIITAITTKLISDLVLNNSKKSKKQKVKSCRKH